LALATPFLADLISWKIAGLLFIPWALHVALIKPRIRNCELSLFSVAVISLIAIHLFAVSFSETPFARQVVKDILIAATLLLVLFTVDRRGEAAIGFFGVVSVYGSLVALAGLTKLALQDRGYLIQFIIDQCPQQYPQGASLCGDYNLTGMMWLLAATGLIIFHVNSRKLWPLLLLVVVMSAGLLAGSRRFLLLMLLLPVFWAIAEFTRRATIKVAGNFAVKVITISVAALAVVKLASAPEEFERFRFGDEKYTVLSLGSLWSKSPAAPEPVTVQSPNRAYPEVIAGTINDVDIETQRSTPEANESPLSEVSPVDSPAPEIQSNDVGAQIAEEDAPASRLDRWNFAFDLIRKNPIVGSGFAYHEMFSCKFVNCKFIDYPHMTIASEWLIAGILGAVLGLLFFVSLLVGAFKLGTLGMTSAASIAVVFTMPYSLISGDTILSTPHLIATGVLLECICTKRRLSFWRST
jgi:hypothetical protein